MGPPGILVEKPNPEKDTDDRSRREVSLVSTLR